MKTQEELLKELMELLGIEDSKDLFSWEEVSVENVNYYYYLECGVPWRQKTDDCFGILKEKYSEEEMQDLFNCIEGIGEFYIEELIEEEEERKLEEYEEEESEEEVRVVIQVTNEKGEILNALQKN